MVSNNEAIPASSFGGKNSKEKTRSFRLKASRIYMENFNIEAPTGSCQRKRHAPAAAVVYDGLAIGYYRRCFGLFVLRSIADQGQQYDH